MRKSIHVIAYAIAGALNFRAFRGAREGWALRWAISAVVLAALVASADEMHQSMVPLRTGTFSDVVIDCAGATLAQLFRRRQRFS
jgi:VanZ family protein